MIFDAGDHGLSEFDEIAQNFSHSIPVARALRAIQHEVRLLPPLRRA